MLKWLMKYVEENIYAWERRREVEKDEQEMNEIFEEWRIKSREEQIRKLRAEKAEEMDKDEQIRKKREKAEISRGYRKNGGRVGRQRKLLSIGREQEMMIKRI